MERSHHRFPLAHRRASLEPARQGQPLAPLGGHPIVLVTGASGQVGRALSDLLPHARCLSREELDVTDAPNVQKCLDGIELVIHPAAITDVDGCETEPETAERVNVGGTRNIVDAASRVGARVVLLSSDYVFDGRKTGEYVEDDPVNPINVYGRTKAEAEGVTLAHPRNLVVRTSWIFGEGKNFIRSILGAAEEGRDLRVVTDQVGRPTSAVALGEAIVYLIEREVGGIVHVAGDGTPCTWFELAEFTLQAAGLEVPVSPTTSEEFTRAAKRPANSALSLSKAKDLGAPLHDWQESVSDYIGGSR